MRTHNSPRRYKSSILNSDTPEIIANRFIIFRSINSQYCCVITAALSAAGSKYVIPSDAAVNANCNCNRAFPQEISIFCQTVPCKVPFPEQTRSSIVELPRHAERTRKEDPIIAVRLSALRRRSYERPIVPRRESYPKLFAYHSIPRIF